MQLVPGWFTRSSSSLFITFFLPRPTKVLTHTFSLFSPHHPIHYPSRSCFSFFFAESCRYNAICLFFSLSPSSVALSRLQYRPAKMPPSPSFPPASLYLSGHPDQNNMWNCGMFTGVKHIQAESPKEKKQKPKTLQPRPRPSLM